MDGDELFAGSARQGHGGDELLAQVMRVRVDAEQLHVHRQFERVHNDVMGLARRYIDRLRAEFEVECLAVRRRVGEKQADPRTNGFGLASGRRDHVQLQDEIGIRLDLPR